MIEPDYTRFTDAELNDTLRHIDGARFPDRAARLVAEIERREQMLSPRERRRAQRGQIFTQSAAIGGIAGAFSFPISYAILSAIYQRANDERIPPTIFYDPFFGFGTIPLGWFLGVAAGAIWASLRVRCEETELNRIEVWRDALASTFAVALSGCLLSPFLIVAFFFLLGIALMLIDALVDLF